MMPARREKSVREGSVEIYVESEKVFYNPVQEFNRDLSIAVLNVFLEVLRDEQLAKYAEKLLKTGETNTSPESTDHEPDIVVLEALSATGLRSIRYAKEIPTLSKVIANDVCEKAVKTIRNNVIHNGVEDIVEVSQEDATMLMYRHREPQLRFAAVDLDPYGCPTTFLDAAVQCVLDGGLLLVTATDMAVLAGNTPESCFAKYGATSIKTKCCHEMALRILLQSIERHAIRYGRYIEPLLSVSVDFYIRVFVKIHSSPLKCKNSSGKIASVYHCTGCDNFYLQPMVKTKPCPTEKNPNMEKSVLPPVPPVGEFCDNCNGRIHIGGPIWTGPLHNENFVSRVLNIVQDNPECLGTEKRILGVLTVIREELQDVPLYYCMVKLFGSVHLTTMPLLLMRSAILNGGYQVSYSHASKTSIKTDAPSTFVWDVVRAWAKLHPPTAAKLQSDVRARSILCRAPVHSVQLSMRADANPASRRRACLRFQQNPAPHWGPGTRAELRVCTAEASKKQKNQNKYKKLRQQKRNRSPASEEGGRKKPETTDPPTMETTDT